MSQYVLDASIAIKWFIPEVYSHAARRLIASNHLLETAVDMAMPAAGCAYALLQTVYDFYLVLALTQQCQIVTADAKF